MKYSIRRSKYPFDEAGSQVVFYDITKEKAEAIVAYLRATDSKHAYWAEVQA